jgi:D-alanine-D-alanine ligase
MLSVRRVAVLIDREQRVAGDPELVTDEARRHAPMEYYLGAALRSLDYDVTLIPCLNSEQLVDELHRAKPDVVFNATEHFGGRRADDVQIPALLERLRLPYTGATAACLALGRDKAASKSLAASAGVRVPRFAISADRDDEPQDVPPFPVVIKPLAGDASEGVYLSSVVHDRDALSKRLQAFHRRYRRAAIIESFVAGADVYAFVLQERGLRILPPVQLCIDADASSPRSMATYHVKHNLEYRAKWHIHCRPAQLTERSARELERAVHLLWDVLQSRDYSRFDFRLTPDDELVFIESNPNPGFSPHSRYDQFSEAEYAVMIRNVIELAAARGG